MTRTRKNPKNLCVKLFGKIGRTLVSDLAYVIVHHLKSIRRTYFGIKGISIPLILDLKVRTTYLIVMKLTHLIVYF